MLVFAKIVVFIVLLLNNLYRIKDQYIYFIICIPFQKLQDEVKGKQEAINCLKKMVVVVDENGSKNGNLFFIHLSF